MVVSEQYLAELRAVAQSSDTTEVPDRVIKLTHDVHGRRLPCEFIQLNEQYVHHLKKIPRHIEADNDYLGMCFGYPGSGKTHLMERTCLYLNAGFGLKDISFTPDQLDDWIEKAPPGSVGLFDEADVISEGYYSDVLRALIRNSKRIRTRNLILWYATPTMADMSKYFAFRAKMVVYPFVPKNTDPGNRGYCHVWHDPDLIADLFARVKKAYSETSQVYNKSFCTLKNKYMGKQVPDDWPIDRDAYEAKKEAARKEYSKTEGLTPKRAMLKERDTRIASVDKLLRGAKCSDCGKPLMPKAISQSKLAKAFDLTRSRYSEILNQGGRG